MYCIIYILFFLLTLRCKNKITETHECKPLKINLKEALFAKKTQLIGPFGDPVTAEAETPSLRRKEAETTLWAP